MAAALPDLSTQTASAEIFSAGHTLPQIRTIHKALHARLDDTAARLRTQVGGSYRELLGTADAIVAMRADMDAVQAALGRMRRLIAHRRLVLQRLQRPHQLEGLRRR